MLERITKEARGAVTELIEIAQPEPGALFVVGCSSSEAGGKQIGTHSSIVLAEAIFEGIYPVIKKYGLNLAAQCCEHLNRALILEKKAAKGYRSAVVCVVPQPHAGGSFATTAYDRFENPVAVEQVRADLGIDIGGTLIGMHLKPVAVPVRLSVSKIGEAPILCARTRPKYIGGERAIYN